MHVGFQRKFSLYFATHFRENEFYERSCSIYTSKISHIYKTRNSRRFAPCFLGFRALRAHLLFKLWTCSFCLHFKTKMKKILRIFKKNSRIFKNLNLFTKLKTPKTQIFKISIIHKPSLGSLNVPQKIWARSVQPLWRLLDTNRQTNKHTDRQAKSIYRLTS